MRGLLKKIERGRDLSGDEYEELLKYIERLQSVSPEAYAVFYDQYGSIMFNDYNIFIPRFAYGRDDFLNYLSGRPELLEHRNHDLPLTLFPPKLYPYLQYTFGSLIPIQAVSPVLCMGQIGPDSLPAPRAAAAILKYEESNPYKEQGLKTHFERLARYSFITRLQSYRYLTGKKSASDRIEFVSSDRLGGIFTNKQKSIYYYLFLTQAEEVKARNACNFLNQILYDRGSP